MKMIIRTCGCCLLIAALFLPSSIFAAGAVTSAGQAPNIVPQISQSGGVTLNVEDAELTDVLKMLAMTLRVNILAGPDVGGVLSINLYDMPFEQALASIVGVSGFSFHKKGNIYYVTTIEASRNLSLSFSDLETRTFLIRNTNAETLQQAVQQFISAAGTVALNQDLGAIVVRDSRESMQAIEELIKQLDVASPLPNLDLRSFPILHSDPTKLEAALKPFLSPQGKMVVNIEDRMIVVQDTSDFMPLISSVIKEHDVAPPLDMRAFRLNHADPAQTLASVSLILSKEGKASLNEMDRTLIVRDMPSYVEMVAELIEQIDIPRRQVFIATQILRVSHDDSLDLRAELSRASYDEKAVSFSRNGNIDGTDVTIPNVQTLGNNSLLQTLNSNLSGFTWHGIWGDKEVFLRALANKSKVDDLAAPELLVLDGESSEMLIGKKLGYKTLVYPGDNTPARETVEYLDVGTELIVTPQIADDGLIKIKVSPKVSSGEIVDGVPQETTTQVDTTFVVENNETIVIGGLMENIKTRSRQQVPFLGDIPVIGLLFGHNTWNETKAELVVLLTPRIVEPRRTKLMEQKIRDYTLKSDIFPEAFLRIVGDVVPKDILIDPSKNEPEMLSVAPVVVEEEPQEALREKDVYLLPDTIERKREDAENQPLEIAPVEEGKIFPAMIEEAMESAENQSLEKAPSEEEMKILPAMLEEAIQKRDTETKNAGNVSAQEALPQPPPIANGQK